MPERFYTKRKVIAGYQRNRFFAALVLPIFWYLFIYDVILQDLLSQLEGPEDAATYPAALVRPRGGELCYFLEATAAAQL